MVTKKNLLAFIGLFMPLIVTATGLVSRVEKVDGINYCFYCHEIGGGEYPAYAVVVPTDEGGYSGDIVIPDSVKGVYNTSEGTFEAKFCVVGIEGDAFLNCPELTSLSIPKSFCNDPLYIYNNILSFKGCTNLMSIVVDPENPIFDSRSNCNAIIKTSTNTIVAGCNNSSIPSGVSIGERAFEGCNFTSITLPDNISTGAEAFKDCDKLTTVIFGDTNSNGYIDLGIYAFSGCSAISDIYCYSLPTFFDPYIAHPFIFDDKVYKNAKLHVRDTYVEDAKEASMFTNVVVDEKVTDFNLIYNVDGEEYKTVKYKYDDEITPEPAPIKEGYTFSGWSEIPERMPGKDVTVTGTFAINKYKLTYMVNGEFYKTYDVEYGSTITPEAEPTKEGYTFSGWCEIPEKMPAEDVTITGSFSLNTYKLIYYVDGEEYRVVEVKYDESITAEPELTRKGMTFSGWGEIPEKMPAEDVTVTGIFSWSKITNNKVIYQVTDTINNYAAVIGNEDASGGVTISSDVEFDYNYKVNSIANNAFNGCKSITSIEISAAITSIGERAFAKIDKLTDVTIYAENVPETDRTAFENSYVNYVTMHVPYGSVDKYKAVGPWKDFKEIVPIEGTEPVLIETCTMPTISFVDGKLEFESETEGAECHYEIKVEDAKIGVGTEVALSSAYEISVYASKEGYNDSEKNIATLYWVNVDPISTGVIENEMRVNTNTILVQNNGGVIAISGVADGNDVTIYNISGQMIAKGKASGNHIEISTSLTRRDICIIKMGDKSVKYLLK